MKKLLLPLTLVTFIATSIQATPKKHKPFFMRHKHKKQAVTQKTGVYRDADIVSFEPL